MRQLVRVMTLSFVLLSAAATALAATPTEFYQGLLQRGIAAFDAERYLDATNALKIAAFGLVDNIDQYQIAQVYLTLSYDRLGDAARARDAARRVIAAERIQRKFSTVALPAGVASSFDALVTKLLSNADAAFLRRPPSAPQPQTQARPQQTATSTPPPAPKPAAPTTTTPPPATTTKPATQTATNNTTTNPKPASGTNNVSADPPKPAPKPIVPPPTQTSTTTTQPPPATKPATTTPATTTPTTPAPKPAAPQPITPQEIATRLASGERALMAGQLPEARRTYRALLDAPGVPRETHIRAAEGLYRARDFDGTLAAFAKVGTLRRGEEPYHYYMAVAYYETGQRAKAKSELAAALPFIEVTPDVSRYRAKIEGAAN